MQRHPGGFARRILGFTFLLVTFALALTSCSKGSSVAKGSVNTGDVSGTADDTSTTDTTTTDTSSVSPEDASSIFNTGGEGNNTISTVQNPGAPYGTEQACLQSSQSQSINQYATSCLSPNQTGAQIPLTEEYLYQGAQGTLGMMQWCLEAVLTRYPVSDADAPQAFINGYIALAECYKRIVRNSQRFTHWNNQTYQNFNYTYNTLNALQVTFRVLY